MRPLFAALLLTLSLSSALWAREHFPLQHSSLPGEADANLPASSACPHDVVVWINPRSNFYYEAEDHAFGRTIEGAYMCRGAADQMGYREHPLQ